MLLIFASHHQWLSCMLQHLLKYTYKYDVYMTYTYFSPVPRTSIMRSGERGRNSREMERWKKFRAKNWFICQSIEDGRRWFMENITNVRRKNYFWGRGPRGGPSGAGDVSGVRVVKQPIAHKSSQVLCYPEHMCGKYCKTFYFVLLYENFRVLASLMWWQGVLYNTICTIGKSETSSDTKSFNGGLYLLRL